MGRKNKREKSRGVQGGRRKDSRRSKPKPCQLCAGAVADWKDTSTLRKYMSDKGKIRGRSATGLCPSDQRKLATAVKNAREMALLPYVGNGR
jgi:small subunit ribosomal protein S18